jgi:cysteine-rich repeat protein
MSPVALADIDGDGVVEVIFTSSYELNDVVDGIPDDADMQLWALHVNGRPAAGFPKHLNGMSQTGPIVADVDADGDADIVVVTTDFIHVFDTGARFLARPWPMFQHDMQRTGCYRPCGDGILTTAIGEQCDDGNLSDDDGCTTQCVKVTTLLRNTDVTALQPRPAPALRTLLPLDATRDAYLSPFSPGGLETSLTPGRPLVFYALSSGEPLRLLRTGSVIRVDF